MERLVVILTGGSGAPPRPLPAGAVVVAADSGLRLATTLGLPVTVVVGDLDSASPAEVADAVAAGARVERHSPDKDETDLDLALSAAAALGATRTIVVGGGGHDRIDHVLANAAVITSPRHTAVAPEWWVGPARVWPVRDRLDLAGRVGDTVSIIPAGGDAVVSTTGLRWPLDHHLLAFGSTRGVSNLMTTDTATVTVHAGLALVAHLEEAR